VKIVFVLFYRLTWSGHKFKENTVLKHFFRIGFLKSSCCLSDMTKYCYLIDLFKACCIKKHISLKLSAKLDKTLPFLFGDDDANIFKDYIFVLKSCLQMH
jgi:hypothetical protein